METKPQKGSVWKAWMPRLIRAITLAVLAGGIAYGFVSLAPANLLEKFSPVLDAGPTSQLDNAEYAAALVRAFPEDELQKEGSAGLTRELSEWMRAHPEAAPAREGWKPWPLLQDLAFSLSVCLFAMALAGLWGFIVLQIWISPGSEGWKKAWLWFLLLLSGIPAAVYVLFLAPGAEQFTGAWLATIFSEQLAQTLTPWLEVVKSGITIGLCLVLGDGLAGTLLLGAQTLASGTRFEARMATVWAGPRFKGFPVPLPGTLAAVTFREIADRGLSLWWSLLGRFLLSEIALEFVLHVFTGLKPPGIGGFLFRSLQQQAPPWAFGVAAALLMVPLALSRPRSGPGRQISKAAPPPAQPGADSEGGEQKVPWWRRIGRGIDSGFQRLKGLGMLFQEIAGNMGRSLREFFGYLWPMGLWKPLRSVKAWWANGYLAGLVFFYFLGGLALLNWAINGSDLLVSLFWFLLLALAALVAILVIGLELALILARHARSLLEFFHPLFRFPLVFWVLVALPALPADPFHRAVIYSLLIVFLVTFWSAFEIGREVSHHAEEDFVPSLENLGHSQKVIYRRHLLLGHCREFVMAQLFNVWLVLLITEVAMGFGVRFGESMSRVPSLTPYKASFGYTLANLFNRSHESFGVRFREHRLADELVRETLGAVLLLAALFFAIWCIQVGIVNLRRAGGLEFVRAQAELHRKSRQQQEQGQEKS